MAKIRQIRHTKETLLFVGEGYCERAFLIHVNGLYSKGLVKQKLLRLKGKVLSMLLIMQFLVNEWMDTIELQY